MDDNEAGIKPEGYPMPNGEIFLFNSTDDLEETKV
jgi:hypothetical protein